MSELRPTTSMPSYKACDHVSSDCPASATTYGYYPDLGVNSFFVTFFALCLTVQLVVGVKMRTWAYSIALGLGTFGELVGYIGRVFMYFNPWNFSAFEMQICSLVLAPSLIAAAIYLTLKHLVLYHGPNCSRLKARLYPWIFISCDLGSIILQAIGGGIAARGGYTDNKALLDRGGYLIIAGIGFQVATMFACGILVVDFFLRRRRVLHQIETPESKAEIAGSCPPVNFRDKHASHVFCAAMTFAYVAILIRCIYRLAEVADGWGNPRMRREDEFLVLDGMMVALASLALTVVHPGYFLPSTGGW